LKDKKRIIKYTWQWMIDKLTRKKAIIMAMRTSPAMPPPTLPTIAPALSPPEGVLVGLAVILELISSVGGATGEMLDCVAVTAGAVRMVKP
jgi:hypothetical protein